MSKKTARELSPEEQAVLNRRRGILIAHVVLEAIVVIGAQLAWWTSYLGSESMGTKLGSQVPESSYLVLAAIVAFFFTSYDLVADTDIQWPPLLASAFALGCCLQIGHHLMADQDTFRRDFVDPVIKQQVEERRHAAGKDDVATVSSATSTGAASDKDGGFQLKIEYGLYMVMSASVGMLLLSVYLTFLAKRQELA